MPNIDKEVTPDKISKLKTYWSTTRNYMYEKKASMA